MNMVCVPKIRDFNVLRCARLYFSHKKEESKTSFQ